MSRTSRITSIVCIIACAFASLVAFSGSAIASGGSVKLVTDDTWEGLSYGLSGGGADVYITEYLRTDFDPDAIICGARVRGVDRGSGGFLSVEVRPEDPGNQGYPDFSVAPIAAAGPLPCPASSATPVVFSFPGAGFLLPSNARFYLTMTEPAHPAGPTGCEVLIDSNGPPRGRSKVRHAGSFGRLECANHFLEIIAFESRRVHVQLRPRGAPRFPGDLGEPVVYTERPPGPGVTDDAVTYYIGVSNGTGGPVSRNLNLCLDATPIGGGPNVTITNLLRDGPTCSIGIMNPLTFPSGKTILVLQLCRAATKTALRNRICGPVFGPRNLTTRALLDDPAVDVVKCVLEGTSDVDDVSKAIGLRCRPGVADDNTTEAALFVRPFVGGAAMPGDAVCVRFRIDDMPRVPFMITGLQLVAGRFGPGPFTGFDAVELRVEDVFTPGCPDLTSSGLLRSAGVLDGLGSVAGGPLPTVVTLPVAPLAFDPTVPFAPNLLVVAHVASDEGANSQTLVCADLTTETLIGESAYLDGLAAICRPEPCANFMLRILIDGHAGPPSPPPAPGPAFVVRQAGRIVLTDGLGNVLKVVH